MTDAVSPQDSPVAGGPLEPAAADGSDLCVWCGARRLALPAGYSTWLVAWGSGPCSSHVTILGET